MGLAGYTNAELNHLVFILFQVSTYYKLSGGETRAVLGELVEGGGWNPMLVR